MRRWLDSLEQFAVEVILGKRRDPAAVIFRWFLYLLSHLYRGLVGLRLALYRQRVLKEHALGCLVVSIGNLTVGGTGKTPVVEKFARALAAGGRRVAILSRGYKSVHKRPPLLPRLWGRLVGRRKPEPPRVVSDGERVLLDSRTAGDEPYMLARNLPGVIVLTDKDRAKSGLHAIRNWNVDTLVLDDGFQHLRLKHRLDIVLIDRQAPFGNEHLLPRGTLREPPASLRRASYIFITKSENGGNGELIRRIRRFNRTAEIIECRHRPLHLQHVFDGQRQPLDYLRDRYVGALSAIAAPDSFEGALRGLGAKVEISRRFADHHRFSEKDIRAFLDRCVRRDLAAVITTEKDAVRFPELGRVELPIYFLRVEIEILSGHESWEQCVGRICRPGPMMVPERFFA